MILAFKLINTVWPENLQAQGQFQIRSDLLRLLERDAIDLERDAIDKDIVDVKHEDAVTHFNIFREGFVTIKPVALPIPTHKAYEYHAQGSSK